MIRFAASLETEDSWTSKGCRSVTIGAGASQLKYLEYYYFRNFIYESVWTSNDRRQDARILRLDLIHRFGSDCKIIFVGDASMIRHKIAERGGSVQHFNAEPGELWL